ncbi:YdcF family protein [Suilimivivens sp.]|uniref:YdcF family protein n=1 Tax=Suilimivivens sp. TaxID=2981669 RepID=UPI0030787227
MYLILMLLGCICLSYFIVVAVAGHGTSFYFIWLFLALCSFLSALSVRTGIITKYLPMWLKRLFLILVGIGAVLFVVVEGMIFTGYVQRGESDCDYLIVLGAQMKPDGPSRVLQYRLDAAYDYLVENPDTKVIVSGGQGSDEMISEAQGMYDYLAGRGIEKERIIREDRSVNTVQNLKYSAEFLDREQDSVCIVSNNFHMFRARRLAEKLGYQKVCGLAAKGDPVLMANNMLREFFGVMKDFTYGNL